MNDHIASLFEETAKLQSEFDVLQDQLQGDEWFKVLMRDMEASQLRKQNELQEYIRHAKQIIAERN